MEVLTKEVVLTPTLFIQFLMLILATIGILLKIGANNTSTRLLINENTIKILNLEKELVQLKHDQEYRLNESKTELSKVIEKFSVDNRDDHQQLFNRLDTAINKMTEVSTAFKVHAENHELYRMGERRHSFKKGED